MLSKETLKSYQEKAVILSVAQRDLLASLGWHHFSPIAVNSASAWEKMGADSNNIFSVWTCEVRNANLIVSDCGETLSHSDASRIILKHRGEVLELN